MLVLGTMMAVEKNVSWGRKISAPLGVVLLGWGLDLGAAAVLAAQHTHLHCGISALGRTRTCDLLILSQDTCIYRRIWLLKNHLL